MFSKVFLLATLAIGCNTLRLNHAQEEFLPGGVPIIWINGFARTLSSTTQAVISAGLPENQFSLFEPCETGNYNGAPINQSTLTRCVEDLMACDMSKMSKESGRTFAEGCCDLNENNWESKCRESSHILIKTVNRPGLSHVMELLEANDKIQMIHVERDPRSIYTSQQANFHGGEHNTEKLKTICTQQYWNKQNAHPRLHKVKFEELVAHPYQAFESLLSKLGVPMTQQHKDFIAQHFNNPNCQSYGKPNYTYDTCRVDSKASVRKWEQFLNAEEVEAFKNFEHCQEVDKSYGYTSSQKDFPESKGPMEFHKDKIPKTFD